MNYKIQTISMRALTKNELAEITALTKPVKDVYADFPRWFAETFIPALKNDERKIIMALDDKKHLAGVILLKDTPREKKICSLYIRKDCRGFGIAGALIQESFKLLKTEHPLLTVSDKTFPQLEKLLKLNHFKFSYKKQGVYNKESTEYYFNNEATEILKEKILTPLFIRAQKTL